MLGVLLIRIILTQGLAVVASGAECFTCAFPVFFCVQGFLLLNVFSALEGAHLDFNFIQTEILS